MPYTNICFVEKEKKWSLPTLRLCRYQTHSGSSISSLLERSSLVMACTAENWNLGLRRNFGFSRTAASTRYCSFTAVRQPPCKEESHVKRVAYDFGDSSPACAS